MFVCKYKNCFHFGKIYATSFFRPVRLNLKQQPHFYKLVQTFSTSNFKFQELKIFSRPRPIVAFNNWIYGNLVRGYFNKDFFLEDFCKSCPIIVEQIIDCLKNNNTEILKDAISPSCLENIIAQWNHLPSNHKEELAKLSEKDFKYRYPTIRMRLPGKIDPKIEIPAFLTIIIQIYYLVDAKELENIGNLKLKLPAFHNFVFESEVTKNVEDTSWKLESCGTFPTYTPVFGND